MPVIEVYSRSGCHLCEVLIEQLLELSGGRAEIDVRDVDSREDWQQDYGDKVPVVVWRGRRLCEYRLDREAVMSALADSA